MWFTQYLFKREDWLNSVDVQILFINILMINELQTFPLYDHITLQLNYDVYNI